LSTTESPNAPPTTSLEPVKRTSKRRRPTGEPPPLPRPLRPSGKVMLALAVIAVGSWMAIALVQDLGIQVNRMDLAILRFFESIRTETLTNLARDVDDIVTSEMTIRILRWSTIGALLLLRRFRHLLVYLGAMLGVGLVTTTAALAITRPRPFGIEILDPWLGASHPSRPLATLAVTLLGILYTLVVPGSPRDRLKWVVGLLLLVAAGARLYLGVDHPTDVAVGLILGVAIPVIAFRAFTPNDVFPVSYGGGRTAHLDVDGARGEAIRHALQEQIGVKVLEMKPFGLEGSGGSTPLRLKVEGDDPDESCYLFAKLYAQNHLRADRWYKVGRTLLYGRLEDETSFSTVRRLVQYEDYLLRVMHGAGINVPQPYGVVEITPEREYLIVTAFVENGVEVREAEVSDEIIDDGMRLVRQLWDAGIAHRDIKPSNLLVVDNQLHLIDVAFGEVRPSPWRQAVDLANMMLVLALRSSAERVYAIALKHFSPDDIAEAFAATRSVTMPSQSRSMLKKDQRNLLAQFRELAPKRRPISIQRWTPRRIGLMISCLLGVFLLLNLAVGNLQGLGLVPASEAGTSALSAVTRPSECGEVLEPLLLVSQSVPEAQLVPCLRTLPVGWNFRAMDVDSTSTRFFVDYDRVGFGEMVATFREHCNTSSAVRESTDKPSTSLYVTVSIFDDRSYSGSRIYVFDGGCLQFDYDFQGEGRTALADEITVAFGFVTRSEIDSALRAEGFSP
jgi:tRNA A-37 threonylcarbamoyl transferase component Bud32/membrane-associated phospholipid phosphatase